MSDVDPTPETPTTIGDRLAWFRGDLVAQLAAIAGAPAGNLGQLAGHLVAIAGQLDGGAGITLYNLLDNIYTQQVDTNNRLDKIQAVLGAEPYSSTETANIRAILLNIMNNASQIGISPDGSTGVVSIGSITEMGRRYILWSGLSGVIISDGNRLLTPQNTWSGYDIYIQTDAPTATLHDHTDPQQTITEFYVNSWVALNGDHQLMFSVDSQYQVRGYMRRTVAAYTYTTIQADSQWYLVPDWQPLSTSNIGPSVGLQNLLGWTLTHTAGTVNLRFKPWDSNAPFIVINPGAVVTLPSMTLYQAGSLSSADGYGPTTFTLSPP